jgi:hypothetical protein
MRFTLKLSLLLCVVEVLLSPAPSFAEPPPIRSENRHFVFVLTADDSVFEPSNQTIKSFTRILDRENTSYSVMTTYKGIATDLPEIIQKAIQSGKRPTLFFMGHNGGVGKQWALNLDRESDGYVGPRNIGARDLLSTVLQAANGHDIELIIVSCDANLTHKDFRELSQASPSAALLTFGVDSIYESETENFVTYLFSYSFYLEENPSMSLGDIYQYTVKKTYSYHHLRYTADNKTHAPPPWDSEPQ